jgi:hypothetical protein
MAARFEVRAVCIEVLVHRYSNMEAILLAAQYYRNVKSVQNGCKV